MLSLSRWLILFLPCVAAAAADEGNPSLALRASVVADEAQPASSSPNPQPLAPSPYNVLVICADDHAAYVTGAYGNRIVQTPNIDRLAAGGIVFDRAYCNSPVCTASRQSFLTGRYPRTLGVTRLQTPLPEREETLADTLRARGYDTAAIGKMHFNSELAHGFDLRIDLADYRKWLAEQKARAEGGEAQGSRQEGDSPILPRKIGTVPLEAQGRGGQAGFASKTSQNLDSPQAQSVAVQPPWRPFRDPARIWLNSDCRPIGLSQSQMDGTYLAQRAAEYLLSHGRKSEAQSGLRGGRGGQSHFAPKTLQNRDSPQAGGKVPKPFYLVVSFYQPHSPFQFPLEYRGRHRGDEFAAPPVGQEDDAQIPAVFRDLTDAEKRGIAAAYYTSVEFMDRCVGTVLDALARSGNEQHTLVIYLGDHGYMLGQHGRFEKHASYEEAVRVPLVMRLPGRIAAGRRSAAFVELVDLVPTLHELCGAKPAAAPQGRSLSAVLFDGSARHREHVIVEYAPNEEVMIRDERWKLVFERGVERRTDGYDTGRPLVRHQFRMYDLLRDPAEMHNMAGQAENAETLKRLTALLAEHLVHTARRPELVPKDADTEQILDVCAQSDDVR